MRCYIVDTWTLKPGPRGREGWALAERPVKVKRWGGWMALRVFDKPPGGWQGGARLLRELAPRLLYNVTGDPGTLQTFRGSP